MAKKEKKGETIQVDFTNVEEGGGRVRLPEGDYPVKVVKVEKGESQSGNPKVVLTYKITSGKGKDKQLKDHLALTPKALWKLRNVLVAMGMNVPKKVVNLNITNLVGKELGITLEDDEYEGKINSKVSDYVDIDTLNGADEEDDSDDDEDSDDEEEAELDELDLDEL